MCMCKRFVFLFIAIIMCCFDLYSSMTPTGSKSIFGLGEDPRRNEYELVKMYIEKGIEFEVRPSFIHKVIVDDERDIIELLCMSGRDPVFLNAMSDLPVERGEVARGTPLCRAVLENNYEISELLIRLGADVNIARGKSSSPLYYAVKKNNFELTRLLIENGADVSDEKYFDCEFDQTFSDADISIKKLLLSKFHLVEDKKIKGNIEGRIPLLFYLACENTSIELMDAIYQYAFYVVDAEFEYEHLQCYFESDLVLTDWVTHLAVIKRLMRLSKYRKVFSNNDLFRLACTHGDVVLIEELISQGVDIDCIDEKGHTALSRAVYNNDYSVVEFLIRNGANLRLSESEDSSLVLYALLAAPITRNREILELLIQAGANVSHPALFKNLTVKELCSYVYDIELMKIYLNYIVPSCPETLKEHVRRKIFCFYRLAREGNVEHVLELIFNLEHIALIVQNYENQNSRGLTVEAEQSKWVRLLEDAVSRGDCKLLRDYQDDNVIPSELFKNVIPSLFYDAVTNSQSSGDMIMLLLKIGIGRDYIEYNSVWPVVVHNGAERFPLFLCHTQCDTEVINFLKKARVTYEVLNEVYDIKLFLERHAEKGIDRTFFDAIEWGNAELVALLIKYGVDVNAGYSFWNNITLSMVHWSYVGWAVANRHDAVVKLLIENGASKF